MPPKMFFKKRLLISVLAGLVFSLTLVSNLFFKNSSQAASANSPTSPLSEEINFPLPARLIIPKINVHANLESVGLSTEGRIDAPEDPENAAWFNLGSRPGEAGSAVITGHSGWKDNKAAVFDNLHKLEKGDEIYVEDEEGVATTFVVREIKSYGRNEYVPEVFASSDGKAHLNLITCTGTWDSVRGTRSNRLVVFADKKI